MSATRWRRWRAVIIAVAMLGRPSPGAAQAPADGSPAQQSEHPTIDSVKFLTFLAGAAAGLGLHEGGHLLLDELFGAEPRLAPIHFGPIPFFAIAHRDNLPPRQEFAVSSAGFWTQQAGSEWLLTARPWLRSEDAPFLKGILAFNVLNSVGYGVVAFARAGPFERDTRGMADAIRMNERAIGAIVIAPALLDAYRYFNPEARWAKWASRAAKAGSVLLVIRR
jgi:hypothetical protein